MSGRLGLVVAALVAAAGCGPRGEAGRVQQAIVGGTATGVPPAVARLTYQDRQCSGVLLAPTLVATARHCVSDVVPGGFACDERGRAIGAGGGIIGDRDMAQLRVEVGGALVGVSAVHHDGAAHLCAHDVAVLELTAPAAVAPARLRVGGAVAAGEALTIAGFGLDDDAELPAAARARTVSVTRVGPLPADGQARAVAPDELEAGEGGCGGDSGGPAFSASGAVVAIYSRGGSDGGGCRGPGARNVYATTRALEQPLAAALAHAGGSVVSEEGARVDAPQLAALADSSGCAFAGRAAPGGGVGFYAACAAWTLLLLLRRRRRTAVGAAA
jgi:hypothetical protein